MEEVMEQYYIHVNRLTQRLQEIALDRDDIHIEGEHYIQLAEKPKGRSVVRRLSNPDTGARIIIYK